MKKSMLIILGVLLTMSRIAHAEVDPCPGKFAQISSRVFRNLADHVRGRDTLDKEIRAAIQQGFEARAKDGQPFPLDWSRWSDLSEEQKSLLERLPKLTPNERKMYIELIEGAKAKTLAGGRFKQFLLLGLYDQGTWTRLAGDPLKYPKASEMAAAYLEKLAPSMPDSLKEDILRAAGQHYEELARDLAHLYRGNHAPIHSVETYFRHLMKGDDLINQEIKAGRSPKEALAKYFQKVQTYVKGGHQYDVEQTLEMLRRMQRLVRHKAVLGVRGKGATEPVIYVGGGLVNGRSTVDFTDIDLDTSFSFSRVDRRELEREIKDYVREVGGDGKHHLDLRAHSPDAWEKQNPVVFKVRPGSIDMMVYDAKGNFRLYKLEPAP